MDNPTEKALEKLYDQLTCSVCLDNYREPRVLPCLHIYCKTCLERLVSRDGSLTCPNCRRTCPVPQGGVAGLQSAFYIHHLVDIRDTLEKVKEARTQCDKCGEGEANGYCRDCGAFICQSCISMHKKWKDFSAHEITSLETVQVEVTNLVPPKKVTMMCQKHTNKPLEIYCEKCEELICQHCTVRTHRDHQYDLVGDCFPKHRDTIVASLQPVKRQLGIVNQAVTEMDERARRLKEQGDTVKEEIQTEIDRLHNALEARKRDLMAQIDQTVKQTGKAIQSQREGYELVQTQLSSCLEFVEESLRTGSQEEILSMKKQVVERAKEMKKELQPTKYQPEPEQMLHFSHHHLVEPCERFGEVNITPLCPEKCYVSGQGAHEAIRGEMATLTLHTVDKEGRGCVDHNAPITGELVSRSDGTVVQCEVTKEQDGTCGLCYQPRSRGQHDLHVKVYSTNIKDSPFPVTVVGFQGVHVKSIEGMRMPVKLAVTDNGEIVVAERGADCLSVYGCDGRKLWSFGNSGSGESKLVNPRGVALCSDNTVLVTANHCIKKFTMEGTFIASVGTRGSGHLQFQYPWDVTFSPTAKKIYICDKDNHRIQVLNDDLTYSITIGSRGSNPGQFQYPDGITTDCHDNVFVADYTNNRVQVFSPGGQFLREIKNLGPGLGELKHPISVHIDNDELYVLEWGSCRVTIFDTKGNFIKTFFGKTGNKAGEFKDPRGIAVDKEGYVYVSDTGNNRIQVFK